VPIGVEARAGMPRVIDREQATCQVPEPEVGHSVDDEVARAEVDDAFDRPASHAPHGEPAAVAATAPSVMRQASDIE
jgi:hypothetical protein